MVRAISVVRRGVAVIVPQANREERCETDINTVEVRVRREKTCTDQDVDGQGDDQLRHGQVDIVIDIFQCADENVADISQTNDMMVLG